MMKKVNGPIVYRDLSFKNRGKGTPWKFVLSGKLSDKDKRLIAGGFAHLCQFPTKEQLAKLAKFRRCIETGKKDVFATMRCVEMDTWSTAAPSPDLPDRGEECFEHTSPDKKTFTYYRIHFDPKYRKDDEFWMTYNGEYTPVVSADMVYFSPSGAAYYVEVCNG